MGKISKLNNEQFKWKCLNYLGGKKCKRCEEQTLVIACYDFHHLFGNKDFELSKAKHKDWIEVQKELSKCIVLCSNCHRAVHYLNEKIIK
jgi:hypothetical protein